MRVDLKLLLLRFLNIICYYDKYLSLLAAFGFGRTRVSGYVIIIKIIFAEICLAGGVLAGAPPALARLGLPLRPKGHYCLRSAKATTLPDHHPRGGLAAPRVPSPRNAFAIMENRFFHSYFLGAFGLPWAIIIVRRVRSLLLSLPASVRFVSLAVAPVRAPCLVALRSRASGFACPFRSSSLAPFRSIASPLCSACATLSALPLRATSSGRSLPRPAQLPCAPVRCVLRFAPPAPAVWVVVPLFKNTTSKTKHDHAR